MISNYESHLWSTLHQFHQSFLLAILLYYRLYIYFSGLNFVDLMVRQGVLDNPPKTPLTMGFECAGDVEAVEENTYGIAVKIQFL